MLHGLGKPHANYTNILASIQYLETPWREFGDTVRTEVTELDPGIAGCRGNSRPDHPQLLAVESQLSDFPSHQASDSHQKS